MKKIAVTVTLTLILLVVVPFLIPTSTYLKHIEQAASGALHQPVSIGSMRVALVPTPRVIIRNISVGAHAEVHVNSMTVLPEFSSLFDEQPALDLIEVDRPEIQPTALDFFTALHQEPSNQADLRLRVKRIFIYRAQLNWDQKPLPVMDVEAVLKAGNRMQEMHLRSVDGLIKIHVLPVLDGHLIRLDMQAWTSPVLAPIRLDSLSSTMTLHDGRLTIDRLDVVMYRGRWAMTGRVSWGQGLQAEGAFSSKSLSIADVTRLFSNRKLVSGLLSGEGTFRAKGRDASQAIDTILLDYEFKVEQGVLYGVDLAKAATLMLNSGEQGGETQFDRLTDRCPSR